jgi:hypothetical protein
MLGNIFVYTQKHYPVNTFNINISNLDKEEFIESINKYHIDPIKLVLIQPVVNIKLFILKLKKELKKYHIKHTFYDININILKKIIWNMILKIIPYQNFDQHSL